MSVLKAQVEGYLQRLCRVESQALANIEFLVGGEVRLTKINGTVSTVTSDYLAMLLNQVNVAINDTNKVVGGEIAVDGTLKLFRANSTEIILGNIVDVSNPARAIDIRNDGRIEVTLKDGTTKFSTPTTIQSAVSIPSGGGGSDLGISILTTPVIMADTTAIGASGSVDIAALGGVTVPVGATHVLLRATVQHNVINSNEDERLPNWTSATVAGKMISYAGRRNVNGGEPSLNYDINATNSGSQFIQLPGNNTLAWSTTTIVAGVTNPAASTKRAIRTVIEVMGFLINGDSQ